MKKSETAIIMAILKEAYPIYYKDKTKEELTTAVNLWTEMFMDDDVNLVTAAVKSFIANDVKGFPPVIGQIKQSLNKITHPEQLTEQEAWSRVSKALKNSAYNSVEEFEKLPKILQRAVGSPSMLREWSQMPVESVQAVVASNFMRSYKVRAINEQEYQKLPNDVKALISNTSEKLRLGG